MRDFNQNGRIFDTGGGSPTLDQSHEPGPKIIVEARE